MQNAINIQDAGLLFELACWINERADEIGLPAALLYDQNHPTGECLWMKPLSGTVKTTKYADGGYVGELPFAVYYQLPRKLTDRRGTQPLSVPLWRIGNYFELKRPSLDMARVELVEMTTAPCAAVRNDLTAADQATYKLIYSKGAY